MQNCNSCNCGKQTIPTAQIYPVNCEFVIPAQYPYVRPAVDSYECCCCPTSQPSMKDYPTSGPFKGNAFALKDANPYLIDSTFYSYGQALSFSENIYTKVTKRDDPSCINLTARFDFTDSSLTNTVRFDFLRNYTARKYEELSGVLPIIKNGIKFRVHYTIYNIDGGIEYIGHTDCKVDKPVFHFTSIKDVFVQSSNGLIIENIPAMTYQGRYTITINNIEAMIEVIDTKAHLQDPSLNPFYTFEDNNRKIILHNTEISQQEADDVISIGTCAVEQSFEYLANISTRLRLNFIAFTSLPIACGDTSPIWFALNEPTEQSITQLRNEVTALEEEVALMHQKDAEQDAKIAQLEGQVELNRQNIATLVQRVAQLEQDGIDMNSRFEALVRRVEKLEAVPLALVTYVEGKEIIRSQITWKGYGNLYQAAATFDASGNFDADVAAGYLVPVMKDPEDFSDLIERMGVAETNIENTQTVVEALAEDVDELKEKELSKNKVVVKNLITGEKQYVGSYGAAATVLRNDLEGSYKVYPGDEYSQNTISAETFMGVTSLKQIELPTSTYEIGKKAFYNSGLTSFEITNNITTVGTDICGNCADLQTVIIDSSSLDLREGAFMNCTNLTSVSLIAVYKLETSVFYNTGITEMTVPEVCQLVNTGCFNKCNNLTSITIDAYELKDHIFNSSANLTTVELLNHVSRIDSTCFQGCPSPLTVNIHRPNGAISGAPWGADEGVTINWGVN